MSAAGTTSGGRRSLVLAGTVAVLLFPMGHCVGSYLLTSDAPGVSSPLLERPAAKYKVCIEDTPYMRFHHMDLIKEIRDAGVREAAIRKVSFGSCRECHTSRTAFCTRCHEAVNLTPDCFHCHYYP